VIFVPTSDRTPKGRGRRQRLASVPDLEAELDDLYGRPLDAFTAARNDLASRLRAAGQDDAAARVAELRKPSLPVWLVNQLARSEPRRLAGLVEAAERLGAAQTGRAKRASPAEAIEQYGEALHALAAEAGRLLDRPPSDDVRRRVSATLRAASLDPARREELLHGRLTEEGEEAGFDLVASLGVSARPSTSRRARWPERDRRKQLAKQLEAARAELRLAREELKVAAKAARDARRLADEAEARAAEVEAAVERAEARVQELETELER
jgi:hypothetical protein